MTLDLARIDLVRDGAVIATTVPELDLPAGWLTLPLRVEWGGGAATVDWSGQLRVHGGQVLQTPYWKRWTRRSSLAAPTT